MRFSLILGVTLLLTVAAPSIVLARKYDQQTCGSLGSGVNACRCGEIVVKAAKVQKPLFYASPEAINEAAVAREAVGKLGSRLSESVVSLPRYKSYTGGTQLSASSSSSSSSAASSSVGLVGRSFIGGRTTYSPFKSVSGRVTSDCGCGKTSESLEVRDLLSSNVEGKVVPSFPPIGDLCYPSTPSGKFQVTTKVTPAYPAKIKCAPPIPYEVCVQVLNGQIDEAGLRQLGLVTGGGSPRVPISTLAGRWSVNGRASSSSAASTASIARTGAATLPGCEGTTNDFGDDPELPEDYSYPRLPADPVSVTLAYKNLFPRTVYYNRRAFVPEDKLAFGHRTVPTESTPSKKMPDVPEEKLQILDKPVVELRPVPSVSTTSTTIGAYDEREEAKLAELEAIERERINQEEIAERQQGNFITYGDLGYAPINRPLSAGPIGVFNAEDDTGAECGPAGLPDPDYVPGSVVVNRELVGDDIEGSEMYVRHYAAGDETSDEEDDSDDTTSGIFARLKSVARKYGPPCGAM